jgi:hypothetical protein
MVFSVAGDMGNSAESGRRLSGASSVCANASGQVYIVWIFGFLLVAFRSGLGADLCLTRIEHAEGRAYLKDREPG